MSATIKPTSQSPRAELAEPIDLSEYDAVRNARPELITQPDHERAITFGAVVIGGGFLGATIAGGLGTVIGLLASVAFAVFAVRR
jgi:outer membrane lipoprotein SlyB